MPKILLADDDDSTTATLSDWLKLQGYAVDVARDGAETLECLKAFDYDVLVLDWDMPIMSGIEVCREFRGSGGVTPILILTGKSAVEQKEQGLEAGADDYVTKPFHFKEVSARLRALLRRPVQSVSEKIVVRDIALNPGSKQVTKSGAEIKLQPMEFTVLQFLMQNPNQYFTVDKLLRRLWDSDAEVSHDAIYSCIKRLRRKLESGTDEKPLITSQYAAGYRLEP